MFEKNRDVRFANLLFAVAMFGVLNIAQVWAEETINPADSQKSAKAEKTAPPATTAAEPLVQPHIPSYEMPAITVVGQKVDNLREEDLIGDNKQPRWTADRRFGEVRIYVMPKGKMDFEYWLIPEIPKKGHVTEVKTQYELEMGLPYRFQLDLYQVLHQEGNDGPMQLDEQKVEVRWAIADWGVIPGNPTLYEEWIGTNDGPDHFESKILFGDELAPRWHWGINLVCEHDMGGTQENSDEVSGGLSYTVLDEKISVGAEVNCAYVDIAADRGNYDREYILGPSFQFRPLPQMHINLATLFGLYQKDPGLKTVLVIGWEF